MITCPNCGAQIKKEETKCPHCGYINIEGAEKKYQADIEEIKQETAEAAKEPVRAFKKGLSKGVKVILVTLGVLAVLAAIYAVMLVVAFKNTPEKFFVSAEDRAYESAYKVVAQEQLNEAYDNNDIARLAEIFDTAYSVDRVRLWGVDHYEVGYAASCYMKLKECLPNLDKDKLKTKEAEEITYYCFYFYYKGYGEDGEPIFDSVRENEILSIIYNRLGFTEEEMEQLRSKVTNTYGVVRSNVHKEAKGKYKNYK